MLNEGEIIVTSSLLILIIFIYTVYFGITINFVDKNKK